MKTYRTLYPEICAFDRLYFAWRKARRGKRYTVSAAAFERNLDPEKGHIPMCFGAARGIVTYFYDFSKNPMPRFARAENERSETRAQRIRDQGL